MFSCVLDLAVVVLNFRLAGLEKACVSALEGEGRAMTSSGRMTDCEARSKEREGVRDGVGVRERAASCENCGASAVSLGEC